MRSLAGPEDRPPIDWSSLAAAMDSLAAVQLDIKRLRTRVEDATSPLHRDRVATEAAENLQSAINALRDIIYGLGLTPHSYISALQTDGVKPPPGHVAPG